MTQARQQCKNCGKTYLWKGNLSRHMLECGNQAMWLCRLCPHRTKRKDNLLRHMILKHGVGKQQQTEQS